MAGKTSLLWKVTETAKNLNVQILNVANKSHLWFDINTLSLGNTCLVSELGKPDCVHLHARVCSHVDFTVAQHYVG